MFYGLCGVEINVTGSHTWRREFESVTRFFFILYNFLHQIEDYLFSIYQGKIIGTSAIKYNQLVNLSINIKKEY